jgi:hypothetical protein
MNLPAHGRTLDTVLIKAISELTSLLAPGDSSR